MATLTKPKPAPTIEPLTPPLPVASDSNTCYICGGAPYRDCEMCDKSTCQEHTRVFYGFCQIERTLCPLCDARKRRDDAAWKQAYRAWKAQRGG